MDPETVDKANSGNTFLAGNATHNVLYWWHIPSFVSPRQRVKSLHVIAGFSLVPVGLSKSSILLAMLKMTSRASPALVSRTYYFNVSCTDVLKEAMLGQS